MKKIKTLKKHKTLIPDKPLECYGQRIPYRILARANSFTGTILCLGEGRLISFSMNTKGRGFGAESSHEN